MLIAPQFFLFMFVASLCSSRSFFLCRRSYSHFVFRQVTHSNVVQRIDIDSSDDSTVSSARVSLEPTTSSAAGAVASSSSNLQKNRRSLLARLYLPEDYPESVGANFARYSGWLMLQNSVGSAAYVLATNALLTSVGVATATALPIAATINWVLKDGLGSLGMIAYAAHVGQRFDATAKATKWRADVLFDLGVLLELLTPLAPTMFLPLASLANVAKGIGGLAAGASKAALHKALALRQNLGDVTAKLYSQGITAHLIGMALGIQLSLLLASDAAAWPLCNVWSVYFGLASVHLFASHRALKLIELPTLNAQRLSILIDDYLSQSGEQRRLLTPKELAVKENIFQTKKQTSSVQLNIPIEKLNLKKMDCEQIDQMLKSEKETFVCLIEKNTIVYSENISNLNIIESLLEFQMKKLNLKDIEKIKVEFLNLIQNSEWDLNQLLIKIHFKLKK